MTRKPLTQQIALAERGLVGTLGASTRRQQTYAGVVADVSALDQGLCTVTIARRNRTCRYALPYTLAVGDSVLVQSGLSSTDLWVVLAWLQDADGNTAPTLSPEADPPRIIGEDLTSQVNGSNLVFNLAYEFVADSEAVWVSGLRQRPDVAYTPGTALVTFAVAPPTGSAVLADYRIASYDSGWGVGAWGAMGWGN